MDNNIRSINIKKTRFAWIISIFFLLSSFSFFPSFSSILILLAGILILPVSFIQNKLSFYLKKPLKIASVIVLMLLALVFLPAKEKPAVENDVPVTTKEQLEEPVDKTEDTVEQATAEVAATDSAIEYHKDKDISTLLISYNKNAEHPIDAAMILSTDHDSANIACNSASVKITHNSLGMFVDLVDEAENDVAIYPLFVGFMKAINTAITTEEIDAIWTELQTGNYNHYDGKYSNQGIDISYDTVELNNGTHKYIVMIEVRN